MQRIAGGGVEGYSTPIIIYIKNNPYTILEEGPERLQETKGQAFCCDKVSSIYDREEAPLKSQHYIHIKKSCWGILLIYSDFQFCVFKGVLCYACVSASLFLLIFEICVALLPPFLFVSYESVLVLGFFCV